MINLPEDIETNWEKKPWSQVKKGDYIIYEAKARGRYIKNVGESTKPEDQYPSRFGQGYVSLLSDDEDRWGRDLNKIIGLVNYGRSWSINIDNVIGEPWVSKKDPSEFRNKRKPKKSVVSEIRKEMEPDTAGRVKRKYIRKVKLVA